MSANIRKYIEHKVDFSSLLENYSLLEKRTISTDIYTSLFVKKYLPLKLSQHLSSISLQLSNL